MASPINSTLIAPLRPRNQSGQPPWTFAGAQIFATADKGSVLHVERVGVNAFFVFGIGIGSAPTIPQAAAAMVSHGGIAKVYYLEAWYQDGRVLGSGWVPWWYIGVYV